MLLNIKKYVTWINLETTEKGKIKNMKVCILTVRQLAYCVQGEMYCTLWFTQKRLINLNIKKFVAVALALDRFKPQYECTCLEYI